MTLDWCAPIREQVAALAQRIRFGEIVVTIRVRIHEGRPFRFTPVYEPIQSYGVEDLQRQQQALDEHV